MREIFILSHSNEKEGSSSHFKDYLLKRNFKILQLTHPLNLYKGGRTKFYENEKVVNSTRRYELGLANLFIDFILSFYYVLTRRFSIFIGANGFDVLPGIIVRFLGKKYQIIFFASDFSEARFGNQILDRIYMLVETIAVKYSDIVISNTRRAQNARIKLGMNPNKGHVILNGVHLDNPTFIQKKINKNHFIYIGDVTREHGVFEAIQVLEPLIEKLVIIGVGPGWHKVEELCKSLKIRHELHFQKDHKFVINYLQSFEGFGLAPYNSSARWTYFSSPLKVSEYIACGVPVIMSDIPEISDHVLAQKVGIVFNSLDRRSIIELISAFNTNDYAKKAHMFYSNFSRDHLYEKIDLLLNQS